MQPITEQPTPALIQTLIREPKQLSEDNLNEIAAELLDRLGPKAVRRVALVAADRRKRPEHRIRALRAVRRIGVSHDLGSLMELFILLSDKNPDIRVAAAGVINASREKGRTAQSVEPPPSAPPCHPLPQPRRQRRRQASPEA